MKLNQVLFLLRQLGRMEPEKMAQIVEYRKPRQSAVDEENIVKLAVEYLRKGRTIAVPTDTVYGVAANAQNIDAVNELYSLKSRNFTKPVALCVANIADIPRWAKITISNNLLSCLLPGPVTLVFERTNLLNERLNPGNRLVGLRIPDYNLLRKIVESLGDPIALTSANVSNKQSSIEIREFESLWTRLSLVIDGGKLGTNDDARLGSTVVDLSIPGYFKIIREGSALETTKKKLSQFGLAEITNAFIN